MKMETLQDLFIDELKDLYNAENQLIKALPKMAKGASSAELRTAFEDHLEQTLGHVERLEHIFQKLNVSPKGKRCKAMKGLIKEGSERLDEFEDQAVCDAGIIAAAQRVEHYEIAGYGCARTFAHLLGQHEAADLLQRTLDEESETDKRLTEIAESTINPEAMAHSNGR